MKTKSILVILGIILIGTTLAFTNAEAESTQYMTIVAKGARCNDVFISVNGQETERLKLRDDASMNYDYSALLALLEKYKSEGWNVKSNNLIFYNERGQGGPLNYFLLEK